MIQKIVGDILKNIQKTSASVLMRLQHMINYIENEAENEK